MTLIFINIDLDILQTFRQTGDGYIFLCLIKSCAQANFFRVLRQNVDTAFKSIFIYTFRYDVGDLLDGRTFQIRRCAFRIKREFIGLYPDVFQMTQTDFHGMTILLGFDHNAHDIFINRPRTFTCISQVTIRVIHRNQIVTPVRAGIQRSRCICYSSLSRVTHNHCTIAAVRVQRLIPSRRGCLRLIQSDLGCIHITFRLTGQRTCRLQNLCLGILCCIYLNGYILDTIDLIAFTFDRFGAVSVRKYIVLTRRCRADCIVGACIRNVTLVELCIRQRCRAIQRTSQFFRRIVVNIGIVNLGGLDCLVIDSKVRNPAVLAVSGNSIVIVLTADLDPLHCNTLYALCQLSALDVAEGQINRAFRSRTGRTNVSRRIVTCIDDIHRRHIALACSTVGIGIT